MTKWTRASGGVAGGARALAVKQRIHRPSSGERGGVRRVKGAP